ncbi:vignain-like [Gossypium hirsutum]|uniref:Vignain-like n=1 Tax=Gossypium hirsutum TaxID=3635 RepID=A0ABM3BJ70_GOSHI|nr:vignain-like [Gossypium hirsutum]
MTNAFDYISQNQGKTTEKSYPYQQMQETCNTQINKVATISVYRMVPENDEEALLKAVTNQPVSVALVGHGRDFKFYNGGVFTGDCGNSLSHAVTIVGYGTSEEGLIYWLIKNS